MTGSSGVVPVACALVPLLRAAAASVVMQRETTEWEDTLRKFGILAPLPPAPREEAPNYSLQEDREKEKLQRMSSASKEELDDLGDDWGDEEAFQRYRAKRLEELKREYKKQQQCSREPLVRSINASQWRSEVTDASRRQAVLVLLYKVVCHA